MKDGEREKERESAIEIATAEHHFQHQAKHDINFEKWLGAFK